MIMVTAAITVGMDTEGMVTTTMVHPAERVVMVEAREVAVAEVMEVLPRLHPRARSSLLPAISAVGES